MSWIDYTSPIHYPTGKINCDWECKKNKRINQNDQLTTSWKHRTYLQTNSDLIINQNTKNAIVDTPQVFNVNKRGYSYNSQYPSDLKQSFLKKDPIVCPSITI
uniref:Uncharacterized protein n=1 Tax=viral metagenome TaxID=1070528 RepID=A0A6C0HSA8_9ZZZZ